MKIKSSMLGIIILVVLLGSISLSMTLNLWQTTSSKVPVTFNEGEYKGQYNPADIRGSYSFGEVSELFEVPLGDLAEAFAIPDKDNISTFKNKDLESLYENLKEQGKEIGNDSVKVFVALYKGLPYELSEDTYLLRIAYDILKGVRDLSQDEIDYLESHTIDLPKDIVVQGDSEDSTKQSNGSSSTTKEIENNDIVTLPHDEDADRTVKGKTTFKEVLDWGVPENVIEGIISNEMPNSVMVIRDYCTSKGIEFKSVKDSLQKIIDKNQ